MSRYPPPIIHPPRGSLPVLLSVPHSGREYDSDLLANAAHGLGSLQSLEDPLVDRLVWRAVSAGVGAVIQPVPRAAIDCNRDEDELDPASIEGIGLTAVGPRARHGLGLVPSRTHRHGALWRRPISRQQLDRRIAEVHRPYHEAIASGLSALDVRFGEALLLDCHSMPSRRSQAEVVVGDRHGSSCANWLCTKALKIIRGAGFKAALNDPYAGGAIVSRHGQPSLGTHALQLEFDRSLYLDRQARNAGPGFDRIAALIEQLATELGQAILERPVQLAAE